MVESRHLTDRQWARHITAINERNAAFFRREEARRNSPDYKEPWEAAWEAESAATERDWETYWANHRQEYGNGSEMPDFQEERAACEKLPDSQTDPYGFLRAKVEALALFGLVADMNGVSDVFLDLEHNRAQELLREKGENVTYENLVDGCFVGDGR